MRSRLLAVLLTAPFLAQADATIANVATPSIHAELGASGSALELVIGGYVVAFAVLLITGARLGETYGYRRLFVAGLAVFTAASLACGLAPSPALLVAARVVQGAGAALMFPQTLTGIQLSFRGPALARAIGLFAVALSCGAVTGQLLGGLLISAHVTASPWRAVFLVNVPVGLAVLVAARRWLPADAARGARRLDLAGVATLSLGVLLVVVPLVLGQGDGWPSWTWLCLAASVPALAAFVAHQRRVARRGGAPLVALEAFARAATRWGLAAQCAATATYFALLFTIAQYLQGGLGRSALVASLTLVPWVAAFGVAGQVVRRLGPRAAALAPAAGCGLLGLAYAALAATAFAGERGELLLLVLLLGGGFALGVQFSALMTHLASTVDPRHAADFSGVATTIGQLGGAVGVAAFGGLYLARVADHRGAAHASVAFADVCAALALVALLSAAMAHRSARAAAPRSAALVPNEDVAALDG